MERTFALVQRKLAKDTPDGTPSEALSGILDALLEASITVLGEPASSSYAVDWTDHETWSRPPPKTHADPDDPEHAEPATNDTEPEQDAADNDRRCADPEASWGHRRGNHPGQKDEAFYGYRVPEHWALPVRQLGADLIQDLHPNDQGTQGTHHGAIRANGRLYCPATPTALLDITPLPHAASAEQTAAHDTRCGELAKYKLSPITAYDQDGYHRACCPAAQDKLRCPLRPTSMTPPHTRPEVLKTPEHPPTCCSQQTITVPPSVNAKTAQKHDYPSKAHRLSYARRSAAERTYATVKDPATNDLSKG